MGIFSRHLITSDELTDSDDCLSCYVMVAKNIYSLKYVIGWIFKAVKLRLCVFYVCVCVRE